MLGTVMGHADEKALLHSILLGAPLDLSQSLLLPVLHILNRETGHFDATPAANLALTPGDTLPFPIVAQRAPAMCRTLAVWFTIRSCR